MDEYIGFGVVNFLPECINKLRHNNVLILHGKDSYASSGAKSALSRLLSGYNTVEWGSFANNPNWSDVRKGLKIVSGNSIDLIIGIGGGSVLDMAKLLSIFAANDIPLEDALAGGFSEEAVPVIAIPTTAGTGSEVTQFAVLWDGKTKYSIDTGKILPKCVIIDPSFLQKQHASSAAAPLMDALAQAVESYWCVNSTPESQKYAKEAIELIVPTIRSKNLSDDDYLARAKGAYLAGKAINITRTTAAHAISYAFTAYYNIAHGHAVMLTLPAFFPYNSAVSDDDCLDKRGVDYVKQTMSELNNIFGCVNALQTEVLLKSYLDELGLSYKLRDLGVDDYECIIRNGFNPQRVKNNPRTLTEKNLCDMLVSL